jgi:hypothetical protein
VHVALPAYSTCNDDTVTAEAWTKFKNNFIALAEKIKPQRYQTA